MASWTNGEQTLFDTLREMAHHDKGLDRHGILSSGQHELRATDYDNWNGGTTYYTLFIYVPVDVYVSLAGERERFEESILTTVKALQRSEAADIISAVEVQPRPKSSLQRLAGGPDSRFWLPSHFRLFISHLSRDKQSATNLKSVLLKLGITSFVAHEDIEPTREWQLEIESALFSMDALAAIIAPGFHASRWTDQEVGVAIGREVAVIPLRYGADPHGLAGKYQGIQAKGRNVRQVGDAVFAVLQSNVQTRRRLLSCLVEQFLTSGAPSAALEKLTLLGRLSELPVEEVARIREQVSENESLVSDAAVLRELNLLLHRHGAEPVRIRTGLKSPVVDDFPF